MPLSRRLILRMCPQVVTAFVLATCSRSPQNSTSADQKSPAQTSGQAQNRPSTPTCGEDVATPTQTEGPFFTPQSPERASLIEAGTVGERIVLTGQVLSPDCLPVANALLDFWHTDEQGQYDNSGYKFRGHQFTDADGRYRIETIVPGIYPGRTRHFHVKVQAANQPVLTTQLYFPEEELNDRDGLFTPELLMSVRFEAGVKQAVFDFVLS